MNSRGFTLIELLIVVAIIAILAAIAVPNFLEAQTRAKISRAKSDMRAMATGLETYHIDNNTYVYQNPQYRAVRINNNQDLVLERLTTPIAYMNSVSSFSDPFKATTIHRTADLSVTDQVPTDPYGQWIANLYKYYARNDTNPAIMGQANAVFAKKPSWYIIGSTGPDSVIENLNEPLTTRPNDGDTERAFYSSIMYNATNGTTSQGSVYRVGGTPTGSGKGFFYVTEAAQ